MSKIPLGKVLMTVTALYAGAGPYLFDWNKTHIHNPDWPPHAEFHNAQTMSLGAALCAATLTALRGASISSWLKRFSLQHGEDDQHPAER